MPEFTLAEDDPEEYRSSSPPVPGARLLPWAGKGGGAAWLLPNEEGQSVIAAEADQREANQLYAADETFRYAVEILQAQAPYSQRELRAVTQRLAECLGQILIVARSRGFRLESPDNDLKVPWTPHSNPTPDASEGHRERP